MEGIKGNIMCEMSNGRIKAVCFSPWTNKTDTQIISEVEPFLQIGDIMTEKGDTIKFGNDIVYTKISD